LILAVVSALRTLQDRIRRLESEKKMALDRVDQLEEELSRARIRLKNDVAQRTEHRGTIDEANRLERLRLENGNVTLKAKLSVLEKRLDYAQFVASQHEQERDEARLEVQDLAARLEAVRSTNRSTSPEKPPPKRRQDETTKKTIDIAWQDESIKANLKDRLMRKIMQDRQAEVCFSFDY
jgi:chromosome segregation ATPase